MLPKQVFNSYTPISAVSDRFRFCTRCGTTLMESVIDGRLRKRCPECDFIQYENPAPAVSVLVVDNERFLLCKRSARTFQGGKWCLPCGYMEYDEDFLTAGRREVREETGLEVRITSILSVVSNFLAPSVHTLVAVLLAEPLNGDLRTDADGEIETVAWFSRSDALPEMAFEADEHIIKRYFQSNSLGVPIDPDFAGPYP